MCFLKATDGEPEATLGVELSSKDGRLKDVFEISSANWENNA